MAAPLRVSLDHPDEGVVEEACEAWFAQLGLLGPGDYGQGGSCIQVLERTARGMVLLLSSGGQDALESLDHTVQKFFAAVIEPEPLMEVEWEELRLH